jgi:hypothetical protein
MQRPPSLGYISAKGSREDLVANKADLFEFNPVTRQALEQADHAVDAYFDIHKEMVSAFPSGGPLSARG